MMMKRIVLGLAVIGVLFWSASSARAWHGGGHRRISQAAVKALPATMPEFFRDGGATVASASLDPDVFKDRSTPQVDAAEPPEHYIDFELLQGHPLPPTRYEYIKLCEQLKLDPNKVGLLPYAVTEWTQKLALAFAEHRRWPNDKAIQAKCLVYAGVLSHYAEDLCQPLHCTVDHDGRARRDHSSPRTGIHSKVDGLIEKLDPDLDQAIQGLTIQPIEGDLFAGVLIELTQSRALIDKVYDLDKAHKIPGAEDPKEKMDPDVVAFTQERLRASITFTARLYLTAWLNSEKIQIPEWFAREQEALTK